MEVQTTPHLHRDWIDSHAFGIVKALQKGGYETYLVGGCVRDLLIGVHPKDFDIATMAHPPQVKRMIYQAYIIGRRFRLVLVKREEQQFEVATFRREVQAEDMEEGEAPAGDNIFGTPEEDSRRRDFTINGLFYDPVGDKLIDYVDGIKDLEARTLRMIGDPNVRLLEDPVRILRALRLSHKTGFKIDPDLRLAMQTHGSCLAKAALPRKREEALKILRLDEPELALLEAFDLGLLEFFIPTLHELLKDPVRCEVFFTHFRAYQEFIGKGSDTVHLFSWIVLSVLQTLRETGDTRTEEEIFNDDLFLRLMRDELGMFRFEGTAIGQGLHLIGLLRKADDFKRKGERRQMAVLRNESFGLAMTLAQAEYALSAADVAFWSEAYDRVKPQLDRAAQEQPKKRRRRKPRRESGDAGGTRDSRGSASAVAGDDGEDDSGDYDTEDGVEKESNASANKTV